MKKILVIDDVPPIRSLVKQHLKAMGYRVETADDGEEGWYQILRWEPDLVITDLMMPRLHGLDLLKRIREHPPTINLPVLCITSDDDRVLKHEAAALGATGWVQKPFHPESWNATLEKIFANSPGPNY